MGLLVVLMWLIPAAILATHHFVDSFFWTPLSDVARANSVGGLTAVPPDSPAYDIILFSLSTVTGIAARGLTLLLIGWLITPFLYFVLARRALASSVLAVLLATYTAYDFTIASLQYNTFAYAWAHTLFFAFVFLLLLYVPKRVGSSLAGKRIEIAVALTLVFAATYFLHPTYTWWILAVLAVISMILVLASRVKGIAQSLRTPALLAMAFFVIYLGFNQLFYSQFVRGVASADPQSVTDQFVSIVQSFLGLGGGSTEPYSVAPEPLSPLMGYAALVRTSAIILCLAALVLLCLARNHRYLLRPSDFRTILAVSLIGAGFAHTAGYALYGHLSLRYMVLIFPFAVLLLAKRTGLHKVGVVFLAVLVGLGAVQTVSYAVQVPQAANILDQTAPATQFLVTNGPESPIVLSDFATSQAIRFQYSEMGRDIRQRFYDSRTYSEVISGSLPSDYADYVIVNLQTSVTSSSGWKLYESFFSHQAELNSNAHLDLVYTDGDILVFNVR